LQAALETAAIEFIPENGGGSRGAIEKGDSMKRN
jgi:hypothetical protein